jgi:hypothetical protein
VQFSAADRDTIIEITRADPEYMLGLLESSMYDSTVDVTDVAEARLIMAELAALCATTMAPGTAARVARFMDETKGTT